jgi:ABC-type branched-subunit amino acid transport system ATPase component/ABC-type branched-subunit amino acid transport system permease subunit
MVGSASGLLAVDVPAQVVFSGAVTGLTYGVMAVGVILVYRSARIINFAVAAMGGIAAALVARLVVNWELSFWVAFPIGVAVGVLVGALVDLTVVRRLFTAPRVILLVATIGVAQILLFGQVVLPKLEFVVAYPTPFDRSWTVGDVIVHSEHLVVLVVVPLLTAALAFFMSRTRYGAAIRAAAANPDAAQLSGISIRRMSTLVWALAGGLSAIASILAAPLTTTSAAQVLDLGPGLLLRVLAAALLARMSSMSIALAAAVAIGVGESVLYYNQPAQRGLLDAVLCAVVLLALLPLAKGLRASEKRLGSWSFAPRVRPIPAQLERVWWARNLPRLGGLVVALVALAPLVVLGRASQQYLLSRMLLYAMVALSLTVLTGWAGQLSLGQFAFVGLGAMTASSLVTQGVGFLPAVAAATAVGTLAALVVGAPALRMPGLFLAVSTLAFAVGTASWLLSRSLFVGDRPTANLPRTIVGPVSLESQRTYYAVVLVVLALVIMAVARVRRSGIGRSMIAVRDNEDAAASVGLSPARVKLSAFAVAGAIAGLAGGLLAGLLVTFEPARFSARESFLVISIAVIGGLASIAGTVLGALWVIGLPVLFDNNQNVALITSGAGLLLLLLYFPGGLVQVLYRARDLVFSALARRVGAGAPESAPPSVRASLPAPAPLPPDIESVLRVSGVTVRFGSRVVVDRVDLAVAAGEVVGLIGSNGAGKSTLMNAVGGFVPSRGAVEVLGRDVAHLSPARRSRLGLGRSFQGAELFADLTVLETVTTAMEARLPSGFVSVVAGLPRARRAERAKRAEAEEIIAYLGLGEFADRFINELSTGTRRVVELACVVACGARVLCLDEPTAGLAQSESEAFGPLLLQIREELDASLLVIEHDMPVVMGISDRVYCLEAGRIIAEGSPETVRNDPLVIASYLGTDEEAINRSGPISAEV